MDKLIYKGTMNDYRTFAEAGITEGSYNERAMQYFKYLGATADSFNEAYKQALAGGSVWTPLQLFANGEQGAWYDPSDLTTLYQDSAGTTPVTADGDPVGLMLDKSGNGNPASQATSARRSLYDETSDYIAVTPDGVDDYLSVGQALNHEEFTAIVVCRQAGDNQRLIDNRGTGIKGSQVGWQIKSRLDSGAYILVEDVAGNYIEWTNLPRFEEPVIITLAYAPSDELVRVNAVDKGAPLRSGGPMGSILSAIDGNLFTALNNIGAQSFSGDFIGALVINQKLSLSEIEKAEQYLAAKAGIQL